MLPGSALGNGLAFSTASIYGAAAERFPGIPLFGVLGGFHLAGPTEAIIPETVDALEAFDLQLIAGAHCTGWRALGQLAQRFGDRVVASAVGKRFVL